MQPAIYFPILRAKAGEMEAVARLSPDARIRVRPLFYLSYFEDYGPDQLEAQIAETTRQLAMTWGSSAPLYLDLVRYPPSARVSSGATAVEFLFSCARQRHIKAIPVTGTEADRGPGRTYIDAVARIAKSDQRGIALRLSYEDFRDPSHLDGAMDELLTRVDIPTGAVDVILDAEAIALFPEDQRTLEALFTSLSEAVQTLRKFSLRTLIVAGSSIPEKLPRAENGAAVEFERMEVLVWQLLVRSKRLPTVFLGDYGVIFPREVDPTGPVKVPSRVRISLPDRQLFFKAPQGEYAALCAEVVRRKEVANLPISWGLNAVRECAAGYTDESSPTIRVARDTNAHLQTTAHLVDAALSEAGRLPAIANPRGNPWLQESLLRQRTDS